MGREKHQGSEQNANKTHYGAPLDRSRTHLLKFSDAGRGSFLPCRHGRRRTPAVATAGVSAGTQNGLFDTLYNIKLMPNHDRLGHPGRKEIVSTRIARISARIGAESCWSSDAPHAPPMVFVEELQVLRAVGSSLARMRRPHCSNGDDHGKYGMTALPVRLYRTILVLRVMQPRAPTRSRVAPCNRSTAAPARPVFATSLRQAPASRSAPIRALIPAVRVEAISLHPALPSDQREP
jgi:hypothetical protein